MSSSAFQRRRLMSRVVLSLSCVSFSAFDCLSRSSGVFGANLLVFMLRLARDSSVHYQCKGGARYMKTMHGLAVVILCESTMCGAWFGHGQVVPRLPHILCTVRRGFQFPSTRHRSLRINMGVSTTVDAITKSSMLSISTC